MAISDAMKEKYGISTSSSSPSTQYTTTGVKTDRNRNDFLDGLGYKSAESKARPEYGETTHAERLAFASRMGFSDSWRGIKQLLGSDEEEMRKDQERLNSYLQNEEYGGSIMAAYTAGLFGDPVGWFLPGLKARNAYKAAKAGAVAGGIAGATGYVDEENGMTRINNTLLGIGGGSLLSPAFYGFQKTILPLARNGYGNALKGVEDSKIMNDLKAIGSGDKAVNFGASNRFKGEWRKKAGQYFVENFGLPEMYKTAKADRRLDANKWAGDFNDVLERFSKLTPAQDRALYRFMTPNSGVKMSEAEERILTADLRKLGKDGRAVVDKMGQELVDLGLLDPKIYKANKGNYLYRSYEKTGDPRYHKNIIRNEQNLGVIASEFVRRGRDVTFTRADLKPGQSMAELAVEKQKEGYRLIYSNKRKAVLNKDFTPKERKQMGEIISGTFALAKTGKLMSNDVSMFKFYDNVAKMGPNVAVSADKWKQSLAIRVGKEDWKQIPMDKAKVGGKDTGVQKFGRLAGHWVPPEVYQDITVARLVKGYKDGEYGGLARLHHKMLQYWKRTKTSLNPVVHMNNVMSNFVLYDLVDANYKHLASAGKDWVKAYNPVKAKRVKSADFREAEKLGVFNADMMKQELTDFEFDTYKRYMKIGKQDDVKLLEKTWEETKKFAGKTPLDKLYSAEDSLFRLGLYKDKKTKMLAGGADYETATREAAKFARKYMLDYEIDAPAVQLMRETAMPFISYTYRAAPILFETAIKRPWKFAKWGLILNAANDLNTDDAEFRTERKRQETLKQGFDVLGIPGANTLVKLPNDKYLDIARWIPAGDIMQTKDQGFNIPFVPTPLQPSGGAIGGIAKAITGFDTFTKQTRPGIDSGSAVDEIGGLRSGRLGILAQEFLPMYNQGVNIWDAWSASGQQHPTKDDRTFNEALLGGIGIKVKQYDVDKATLRVNYKFKNRIDSLTAKIRQMTANKKGGRMNSEKYNKEIDRLKKELKKIQLEAREALKKVQ